MSHHFIDHAAAEAAIAASNTFAQTLEETATDIEQLCAELTGCWRGSSADAAQTDIITLVQRLQAAAAAARDAASSLEVGNELAFDEEREADRREEEERARREAEAAAQPQ